MDKISRAWNRFITEKYWVYFFPFFMDVSLASFAFAIILKAISLRADPVVLGFLGAAGGVAYFMTSLAATRLIRAKNAVSYMKMSAAAFIGLAFCLAPVTHLPFLFVIALLSSFFAAFFFIGFQLYMGICTSLKPAPATGLYTLFWSCGLGLGFLSHGVLAHLNGFVSVIPIAVSSLAVIIGIRVTQPMQTIKVNSPEHAQSFDGGHIAHDVKTAYVRLGWLNIFVVSLISFGIRCLLPKIDIDYMGFSSTGAGFNVFAMLAVQGITGALMVAFPSMTYRLNPHKWFKVLFISGTVVMMVVPGLPSLILFTICAGMYAGHAFYSSVYYALNHPLHARNIAINETFVGIANVAGPLMFGAALHKGRTAFFALAALLIFAALCYESVLLKRPSRGSS